MQTVLQVNFRKSRMKILTGKMKKQMNYANDNKIPFVAIIGETELQDGTIAVKNMNSGEQKTMSINELIDALKWND